MCRYKKSKQAKFEVKIIKFVSSYSIMFLKIVIKTFFKDNVIIHLAFTDLPANNRAAVQCYRK